MSRNKNKLKPGNNRLPSRDIEKTLLIEYKVNGFGTEADLDKRWKVQNFIGELLNRTRLGICDGGRSGSNTMDIVCLVYDFKSAKKAIEIALTNTSFADYTRIVEENKQYWTELNAGLKLNPHKPDEETIARHVMLEENKRIANLTQRVFSDRISNLNDFMFIRGDFKSTVKNLLNGK